MAPVGGFTTCLSVAGTAKERSGTLMLLEAGAPAWTSGCAAPLQQHVCSCGVLCLHAEAVERMRTRYEPR